MEVRGRTAAFAGLLPVALALTVVGGAHRSHQDLPAAERRLSVALDRASELAACLQEAQDELYPPNAKPDAASRNDTLLRLRSCPADAFARSAAAVHVPKAPAVDDAAHQRARVALTAAAQALSQAALNARVVVRVSAADASATGAQGGTLVLGFRAFNTARMHADVLLTQVHADLEPARTSVRLRRP